MIFRIIFVSAIFTWSIHSFAQNLSKKTNDLHLNFKNGNLTIGSLPSIHWLKPFLDFTSSIENKIEIEAEIANLPELKARLLLGNSNDGTLFANKTVSLTKKGKLAELRQTIFLPEGSNFVSIELTTAEGVIVYERRTILVGKDVDENLLAADRKDFGLFFATDKYDHWDDLVNPIDDAHAIAKELKEKFGFEIEIVENPTVEQIWEKLRLYNERKFKPQDQLMIFFAGHGYYDESFGEGFVVAKNSLQKDISRNTYLSHNRLRGVINNIPSKHILLAMDVCFGGTLDPTIGKHRGGNAEITMNEMLSRKFRYRTRKYLTSGGKEYVSDGIAGKHSPFAEKIIESLRSRGGDDAVLTLAELQVNLEKLKQLPRFGSFGDDESLSDFVFLSKLN